jgi:hypothetical protein
VTVPDGGITPIAPVSVTGGVGGTAAHYDDMEVVAGLIAGIGEDVLGVATASHGMLVDANVVASASLHPAGVARFEVALANALDGEGGLANTAARIGASAVRLRAAVATYRSVEETQTRLLDVAEFVGGPALMLETLAVTGGGTAVRMLHGHSVSAALQGVIVDHPGLVDSLAGGAPGTLSWLVSLSPATALAFALRPGLPTTVPEGAALLGTLYPDGSPKVTYLGSDDSITARKPPRNVTDLMVHLDQRKAGDKGEIDVRTVQRRLPDGALQRAYIVDIPGTKVWNLPGQSPDVNDTGTNMRAIGNETTTYQRGIDEALARAGVKPGDPVMLIGHSQGGIVAANAARDFVRSGKYTVTHVLTAGSPVAQVDVPPSVQVLAIENRHDIVPHLDARDNPGTAHRVTVTVDRQHGTVGDNHSLGKVYVPAAAGVDQSGDPSIRSYVDSADPFLSGDTVTTQRLRIERIP